MSLVILKLFYYFPKFCEFRQDLFLSQVKALADRKILRRKCHFQNLPNSDKPEIQQ